ncbi:MAG TPA: DUF6297 family protein [Actinomycetota bacterium]|nr:DUF6297 family protein [Actinomycetota bacterium]
MTAITARALVRFVRRAHREKRSGSILDTYYPYYVALLPFLIFGAPIYNSFQRTPFSPETTRAVVEALPLGASGVFLALFAAAVRFATWRGPVAFSKPDVVFLLTAPVARADFVRPRLLLGIAAFGGGGLLLGILLFAVGEAKLALPSADLAIASLASMIAAMLLAGALAWATQRSLRVAESTLTISTVAFAAAIALMVWAPSASEGAARVVLWSGPWGWAAAPLAEAAGASSVGWAPAIALVALAAAAVVTTILLVHIPIEELDRRAHLQSGIAAALYVMDVRGISLLQWSAKREITGYSRLRVRRPKSPTLVIPWRDALALRRSPGRVVAAAGSIVGGSFLVATSEGGAAQLIAGVIVAYLGAARVVEPVRIEADDPEAGRRLPWSWPGLLFRHSAVPWLVLTTSGWIAAVTLGLSGTLSPADATSAAAASPVLALGLALVAVVTGARGRVPQWLVFYGGELVLLWFLTGPLVAAAVVGLPMLLVVTQGEDAMASAVVVQGLALVGVGLWLRRRKPPD